MKALKAGSFLSMFGKPGEVTLIGGRVATGKSALERRLIREVQSDGSYTILVFSDCDWPFPKQDNLRYVKIEPPGCCITSQSAFFSLLRILPEPCCAPKDTQPLLVLDTMQWLTNIGASKVKRPPPQLVTWMQTLRQIAKEKQIAVVVTTHLPRTAEARRGKRIYLRHISVQLRTYADNIGFLLRDKNDCAKAEEPRLHLIMKRRRRRRPDDGSLSAAQEAKRRRTHRQ